MELASLLEEARVHLAEGEEAAAEDEEEYDDEEDETIGNLMIITEELDEAESYFLSNLKVDGEYADKEGDETIMRKNFYASRLLKIPWVQRPDAFRKIVEDSMNSNRARFVLQSVNNGRIVDQFRAKMGDETKFDEELKTHALECFEEFKSLLSNVKFTPEILSLGDQNVHETATKPWGEEGWNDIVENALMSEIDDCSRKEYEQESLVKEEHEISCQD